MPYSRAQSGHHTPFLSRRQAFGAAALLAAPAPSSAFAPAPKGAPPREAQRDWRLTIGRHRTTIDGKTVDAPCVNNTVPGPILRWKEGDTVTLAVTNTLDEPTSIHWHGIRLPFDMDGVPGLSFAGIEPGQTFTYRFPVRQSGTYWYHSHSGGQEAQGLSGAIVIDPAGADPNACDRDYVVFMTEWTDVAPADIVSNLKMQDDYYIFRQRSVASLPRQSRKGGGLLPALGNRLMWSHMRMAATDIADVSGVIYSYTLNGLAPQNNWTGIFRPGERVRLRFINGCAMSFLDVRIPGLEMKIVAADGNDVEPVPVDEFRIGVAETYDVIVEPREHKAYTLFVQSEDRTGHARGTLAPAYGMTAPVPPMDPRPVRDMVDMGEGMPMKGMGQPMPNAAPSAEKPQPIEIDDPGPPALSVENQHVAPHPINRTGSPGDGLEHTGRRVLNYRMLRATKPGTDSRPPSREIVLHLTGNMYRYIWGFNGRKFSESGAIRLRRNERIRIVLINDTMMEHPIHLHGLWSELENGQGDFRPYKHTIISQPGSRTSYLVTADAPGYWAYHCHLLYHMELGMFRTVHVA